MKSKIRFTLILLIVAAIAFVAGRSSSVPVPPNLPAPFDPVAIGLEGKRAALAIDMWPLERVLAHLSETYGTQIIVDWKALEAAGVGRSDPVVIGGDQLNLAESLCRLDHQLNGLTWTIRNNELVVSSNDSIIEEYTTHIYDLGAVYRAIYGEELASARSSPPDDYSRDPRFQDVFVTLIDEWIDKSFADAPRSSDLLGGFYLVTARPYDHVRIARLLNWLADKRDVESFVTQYRAFESPEAGRW